MHTLSAVELLDTWERGWEQPPVQRALTLLIAAFPHETAQTLGRRSIGQRNALLLSLREQLFGRHFVAMAGCPQCDEQLELSFATMDLTVADLDTTPAADDATAPFSLQLAEYDVHFRLPNSFDLIAMPPRADPAAIRQMLLQRCLVSAQRAGADVDLSHLPPALLDQMVEQMEQADPQANMTLALTCPQCDHAWPAHFDILAYLWRELDAWAVRMLRDVHRLASAYGWSELNILHMSPWRRQIYLDLIEQ